MIRINEKLDVFYSDNSVFYDLSDELVDYSRRVVDVEIISAEDKIFIGFYKPINVFYTQIDVPNINASKMALKYYNGVSYEPVPRFYDDTEGFKRSGFVRFDRNIEDQEKSTVNGVEQYWYELTLNSDSSAMVVNGLNIVFSDDQDLKRELYEIEKFLPVGVNSHILSHVSARDEIIQELRADGRYKKDFSTGKLKDITAFDLLDISQVNTASKYLTLSKILFSVSDNPEDFYSVKANHYRGLYNKSMKTFYLSVDVDDDGKVDNSENMASNNGGLVRR